MSETKSECESECELVPRDEWGADLRVLVVRGDARVLALYWGRTSGARRSASAAFNWLDDGALALGTACYALLDGAGGALLVDAAPTPEHAHRALAALAERGVDATRVCCVLSHHHADHVAGVDVLRAAGAAVLARERTASLMASRATASGPPFFERAEPTKVVSDEETTTLQVGKLTVELRPGKLFNPKKKVCFKNSIVFFWVFFF